VSAATVTYSRREPALGPSLALSALAHVVLIAVLFLGVRFQSSTPATVEVELWEPPPPAPPAPVVEEPKPPPPPPPVVKPEPEPEVKKPEIALPEKPKPKPKPEPKKVEAKPKPKPKPEPKRDLALEKMAREEAAREQQQLATEERERQERQMRELIARQQAAATQKALATWTDKIRGKIRGNIILPHDIPGNPEAIFDVTLLPSGEVLTVRKRKSSGHPGYDDAVERAIMKSSPLPLPDDRSVFRRDLELKFRPQDR
jgi:colicin import membrane protein